MRAPDGALLLGNCVQAFICAPDDVPVTTWGPNGPRVLGGNMARGAGSNSRKRANLRRYQERQKQKAAKRAEYASMSGTAANVKRKGTRGTGGFNSGKHMHLMAQCGNTGCSKCFPRLNRR